MKKIKILKHLKHPLVANDLLGGVVVYVLIIWVTYFIVTALKLSHSDHHRAVIVTHWIFGGVMAVIGFCRVRVSVDIENKKIQRKVDICLSCLIWPAIIVLSIISIIPIVCIIGVIVLMFLFKKLAQLFNFLYKKSRIIPGTITALLAKSANLICGMRQKNVQGEIPKDGTFIIVYGHESSMDYFLWPADLLFRAWKIVAGTNLSKFPIFGIFLDLVAILIDRESISSAKKMLTDMISCLNNEISVGIAPEKGRFRIDNKEGYKFLRGFSDGAFKASVLTGRPLLPVMYMFAGENKPPLKEKIQKKWWDLEWLIYFLTTYQWFNKVTEIWRVVLDPIYPEGEDSGYTKSQRIDRLKKKTRNAMIKRKAYWWGVKHGRIKIA